MRCRPSAPGAHRGQGPGRLILAGASPASEGLTVFRVRWNVGCGTAGSPDLKGRPECGTEDDMTVSEQVDALQAKVADLKSSLDASRHETNEQIKARVADAKAEADAAKETVHGKADQAADHAHTQWQSFKANNSAKMQELQERAARKR